MGAKIGRQEHLVSLTHEREDLVLAQCAVCRHAVQCAGRRYGVPADCSFFHSAIQERAVRN